MSTRIAPASAMVCIAALLIAGAGSACTVTVDVAGKKAVSDNPVLDAKVVRVMGDQVGVLVYNTTMTPQRVRIRFNGLKDQDYDLYINSGYSRVESCKALAEGLDHEIPGTVADPVAIRCLKALESKVAAIYDKMRKQEGEGPARTLSTLQQANEWIASGFRADTNYRSVEVILVPQGTMMQRMVFASRQDAEGTVRTGRNACNLLQVARSHMFRVLTDPDLRNEVVEALTPVSFTALYTLENGKPVITAVVRNDCDFPISGTITATLPNGWSVSGGRLEFTELASGEPHTTSFGIANKSKTAKPPASVPLTAVVTLSKQNYVARVWLFTTAEQ